MSVNSLSPLRDSFLIRSPAVTFPGLEQAAAAKPQSLEGQDEKTSKIEAFIGIEPEHKTNLKKISTIAYRKIIQIIGVSCFHHLRDNVKTISLKNAIVINEIAGIIFAIEEKAVKKYAINQDQKDELLTALELPDLDKKMRKKIYKIGEGKITYLNPEDAKQSNV